MQCKNCKSPLPEAAKFCGQCGAKADVSLCPNGHVLEAGETVCRYCPPPRTGMTDRVSVSTSLERPTAIDRPTIIERPTVVEQPMTVEPANTHDAGKTSVFSGTRIYDLQEAEPARLVGWLVIMDGPERDRDFRIKAPRTIIGRTPDCDVILDNPHTSTKHASIRLLDEVLYITDLDSSNGTYVNAREITKSELKDNDTVTIGDISLKFRAY